jgi:Ni,Fe-hydrogenase III small subunit
LLVDLFIPGWPPHPLTILDGLLRLLGHLEEPESPSA